MHLSRVHGVRGAHRRVSMKIAHRFFPLLKKRRWAEANRFLMEAQQNWIEDDWIRGYIHALRGMLISLRVDQSSPRPYFLEVRKFDVDKLQETREEFLKLLGKPLNTNFDEGYFQAWLGYINHIMSQKKFGQQG